MSSSLFNTILLGDGRLPTGGYSDSAGLEPAVMAGLKLDRAYDYMVARLRTLTKMEAGSCILAHRLAALKAEVPEYSELETAVDARTPSPAQRKASRYIGRAILFLGNNLAPEDPGISALNHLDHPPTRGVAMGVLAQLLNVDEQDSAQVCCFDDMQRITEAVLKLLPTDPVLVARWTIEVGKEVPGIVKSLSKVEKPADLPAVSAPWMEHWAEEHAKRTKRLFMA